MKRMLFVCVLVALLCLGGCTVTKWVPDDGTWYCEELQIQLSFTKERESFAIIDGQTIICVVENDRGSKEVALICQSSNDLGFQVGDVVFCGEYVELSERQYILKDYASRGTYIFKRIDER